MRRAALLFLISLLLLFVRSTTAADKKDAPRTLAEDAKLLGEKNGNWISEGTVSVSIDTEKVLGNYKEPKVYLTFHFAPEKGKPSGQTDVGSLVLAKNGGLSASQSYQFELIEKNGKRAIKLAIGKEEPRILHYSLVGDKLTIHIPLPSPWGGMTVPMQFKRNEPKKKP